LQQAANPTSKSGNRVGKKAARQAAVDLIRIVADHGHTDEQAGQRAFEAGIALFGGWADGIAATAVTDRAVTVLDQSLTTLKQMNSAGRQSLIRAVSETITHDGKLTLSEAELLRAICATFDCPLPPILADDTALLAS